MSTEDLRRIAVAAADKEAAAFELDHADLNLKEAVVVALEHGTTFEVIAEVADLEPEEIIDLVHDVEESALLTMSEIRVSDTSEARPLMTELPTVEGAG